MHPHWVRAPDGKKSCAEERGCRGPAGKAFGGCGFDIAAKESPGALSEELCLLSFSFPEMQDLTPRGSEAKVRSPSETLNRFWVSHAEWDKEGHLLFLGD